MPNKYYVVKVGRKPGIYNNWIDCKSQILHFKNAIFKSFDCLSDAESYYVEKVSSEQTKETLEIEYPAAFIDGSNNPKTGAYGYGCVIYGNEEHSGIEISGCGNDTELMKMRNVSGELLASMKAIEEAIQLGFSDIHIYYDYLGIEMWTNNSWECNNDLTKNYKEFVNEKRKLVNIFFHKVPAHTGVEGNEIADQLAKSAVNAT